MKKLVVILLLASSVTLSGQVLAEIIYFTGNISTISATESSVALDGQTIVLEGVANSGVCAVANNNRLHLIIKDDSRGRAQYSLALSAMMADREVNIVINDLLRHASNICYLREISINKN